MGIGTVAVVQDNNASGGITAIERKSLWIGIGGADALTDQVHAISATSDLDAILGSQDSDLKNNIEAAMLNAGQNFTAYAIAIAQDGQSTWDSALEFALDKPNDLDVEMVVLTDPITKIEDVNLIHAACVSALATFEKYISAHVALPGIADGQTWSEYLAATKALQQGVVAKRVCLVPQIHGNNLGVVIGRLNNDGVSIADTPMRTLTGAVVGLGADPVDKDDLALTMAHLKDLADNRLSVPQTYTSIDGTYWADHSTLDAAGGDFQVYENLRVMDYVCRRIYVKLVQKVGDRSLNSSDSSIAYHQDYFMDDIYLAAKETLIAGETKPGLVQKPEDGDIVLTINEQEEVEMWIMAAPIGAPKKLTAHISLDLNR
jgi:hypothetical protein